MVDSIISITNNELSGVYNIAYGKEYSVKEIVDIVLEKTNSSSSIKNLPWRSGEKGMKLSLSIDKAKRDFGYSPKVSFEEGIESTVQWLRNL